MSDFMNSPIGSIDRAHTVVPPSEQETILTKKMVDATHEYMCHIKKEWMPKMARETAGYVFNQHSIYYNLIFGKCKPQTDNHKKLYNQLVLITHPDKCNSPDAGRLFNLVSGYYTTNNTNGLQKMLDWWDTNGSFEGFEQFISNSASVLESEEIDEDTLSVEDKKNLINKWQSELWYVWYSASYSTILKDIYMPYEEYVKRCQSHIVDSVEKY